MYASGVFTLYCNSTCGSHLEVCAGDRVVLVAHLLDLIAKLVNILLFSRELLLDGGVHCLRHTAVHHALGGGHVAAFLRLLDHVEHFIALSQLSLELLELLEAAHFRRSEGIL